MDATQSFRLSGTTDIDEIPCSHVNGQNVIFWEDIEDVYHGLRYIKHGSIVVTKLRDMEGKR